MASALARLKHEEQSLRLAHPEQADEIIQSAHELMHPNRPNDPVSVDEINTARSDVLKALP